VANHTLFPFIVLQVAPSAAEVVVIALTVSIRTEGINATSFKTGDNPPNEKRDSLTNATAVAVDDILQKRGDMTELSSVSVTSVEDSSEY
jgi:hypothetical protein